jgi:hypothetical protein
MRNNFGGKKLKRTEDKLREEIEDSSSPWFCFFNLVMLSHWQSSMHKRKLAKFWQQVKEESKQIRRILLYLFWLPARIYCLNMAIPDVFPLEIWQFWHIHSLQKNPLSELHWTFFGCQVAIIQN